MNHSNKMPVMGGMGALRILFINTMSSGSLADSAPSVLIFPEESGGRDASLVPVCFPLAGKGEGNAGAARGGGWRGEIEGGERKRRGCCCCCCCCYCCRAAVTESGRGETRRLRAMLGKALAMKPCTLQLLLTGLCHISLLLHI